MNQGQKKQVKIKLLWGKRQDTEEKEEKKKKGLSKLM